MKEYVETFDARFRIVTMLETVYFWTADILFTVGHAVKKFGMRTSHVHSAMVK